MDIEPTSLNVVCCAREGCSETFTPKTCGGPPKLFCSRKCAAAALRAKHPGKAKTACARWRVRHPEKVKSYSDSYYADHSERIKKYQAARRAANPNRAKEYSFNNREIAKAQRNARRDYNYVMLAQKFGPACVDCGRVYPMGVYHYHHVAPHTKNGVRLAANGWLWPKLDGYTDDTVQLCPTCHALRHYQERPKTVNRKRDNNYLRLIDKFGPVCSDCHAVFPMAVYQYHHLDPATKDGRLRIEGWVWSRVDVYTNGTIQLCPTCHALRHYQEINRKPI